MGQGIRRGGYDTNSTTGQCVPVAMSGITFQSAIMESKY